MRRLIFTMALIGLSSAACAQVSDAALVAVGSQNCPVAASAERGARGAVVQTRSGEPGVGDNRLHIHFYDDTSDNGGAKPVAAKQVADAEITLHGTDNHPRAELTSFGEGARLTENFHLTGSADHSLRDASVFPTKVTNVRWLEITSLRFTDGSSWHRSSDSFCSIQPNGFHLVGTGAK